MVYVGRYDDYFKHDSWNEDLRGKKVFFGNSVLDLEINVNCCRNFAVVVDWIEEGFVDEFDSIWKYCYYDPAYGPRDDLFLTKKPNYKYFDSKFMKYNYEPELQGKDIFVANSYRLLREAIENNDSKYKVTGDDDLKKYTFFYFDPNYNVKRAFYEDHKKLEVKKSKIGKWLKDFTPEWKDNYIYRLREN